MKVRPAVCHALLRSLLITGLLFFALPRLSQAHYDPAVTIDSAYIQYHDGDFRGARLNLRIFFAQKTEQDKRLSGRANLLAGYIYESEGEFKDALHYYRQALAIYLSLSDYAHIADVLNNVGNVYYRQGQYARAFSYIKTSLQICKRFNYIDGQISCYNSLGNIYYSWGRYNYALDAYMRSLRAKHIIKDSVEMSNILSNIGSVYTGIEKYDSALITYEEAKRLAIRSKDRIIEMDCDINISYVNIMTGKIQTAVETLKKTYCEASEKGYHLEELMSLDNLARAYMMTNRFDSSDYFLRQADKLATEMDIIEIKLNLMESRIALLEKSKRIPEAYELSKKHRHLHDSIFDDASIEQLIDFNTNEHIINKMNELQYRNLELSMNEQEYKSIQKIAGLLIIIILGLVFTYILMQRIKQKNTLLRFEKKLHDTTQQALAAQMNPHFISNSLNSIQKFFLSNDIDAASQYLNSFGNLIRVVLDCSMSPAIPVSEELRILKLYVELESMRLGRKIELNIDNDCPDVNIPPLILQPVVENSIWHGLAKSELPPRLDIVFRSEANYMICEICDNGIGLSKALEIQASMTPRKRKSYGLQLLRERLSLLAKRPIAENLLSLEEITENGQIKGTRVIIKIPVE